MDLHGPPRDARPTRQQLNRLVKLAPGAAAGLAASVIAGAGLGIAALVVLAGVLDRLLTLRFATADLAWPFIILAALAAARALCVAGVELCGQRLASTIKAHVRRELVAAILARSPRALRTTSHPDSDADRTGELVADVADGVEKLEGYYRRYLPQVVAAAITPVFVIGVAAWFDPASAAILAVTAPLVLVFLWLLGTRAEALARRQWRTLRQLSGLFLGTLQALTTAILFGRADEAVERLDASGEEYRVATMRVLRTAFLSGFVIELAATLSTALVAVGVGVRLIEGWISFGPAIAVLLLTPELYAPLRLVGQRRHAAMEAIVAAERLFAWADRRRMGHAAPLALGATVPEVVVRFEAVSFRYPDAAHDALSAIDLELRPRTLTALVGASGAGKSTLVDLLLRFAEPTGGVVRANGQDLAAVDPRDWRRHLAFVPQRPRFLDGSVLDNLRVGRADASLAEVRAAAARAEIDAFVIGLPQGYDTSLGEMAGRSSVGERQRLALARALIREAPLLVLDEPSSSLDPVTEAAITRVLDAEARRRTVLVVAHRLRTVRSADRLIVLERGRLVESGSHDDLVRRGGVYARFVGVAEAEAVQ